jgi:hypothetical protein
MLGFLLVLVFIWAMPTHYAARLLLDTDRRFRLSLFHTPNGNEPCSKVSAIWMPRTLGLLTFVAVLTAIWRSSINVPEIDDPAHAAAVYKALIEAAVLVIYYSWPSSFSVTCSGARASTLYRRRSVQATDPCPSCNPYFCALP